MPIVIDMSKLALKIFYMEESPGDPFGSILVWRNDWPTSNRRRMARHEFVIWAKHMDEFFPEVLQPGPEQLGTIR